ncbi:sulfotransferase family protein [Halanaerobium kushneri]|uniref:Sulfotransferase family protein n=1 Tax=Halanaerobium kushneri TaxID=56779 RepID=A0A1N7BYD7_9FIRM|nr:sulfotransferase [Halanaerobium kushneri]SIR56316.1 Sulfotransferase family protein [Halanaerobium kushneri]
MRKEIKTVVVLGMHRSGTSMTSAILEKLGINMGEDKLGATATNPIGHFEDKMFLDLNRKILNDAGGSWDNPPSKDSILNLKNKYKKEIKELLSNKIENWGWKEPRTSLTIDLYYPFLSNTYFVYCKRDEDDVAASLKKRNDMALEVGKKLKFIYDSRVEEFLNKIDDNRKIIFDYDEVLKSPEEEIEKLIKIIDLNVSDKEYDEALNIVMPKDKLNKLAQKRRKYDTIYRIKNLIIRGIKEPSRIPYNVSKPVKEISKSFL